MGGSTAVSVIPDGGWCSLAGGTWAVPRGRCKHLDLALFFLQNKNNDKQCSHLLISVVVDHNPSYKCPLVDNKDVLNLSNEVQVEQNNY